MHFTARARFYKAFRTSDTHKLGTTISRPYSRRRGNKFTACFPSKQTGQTEYDVGQWAINNYDRVSLDLLPHPEWTFGAYVYIHTRHINSTKRTSSKKDAPVAYTPSISCTLGNTGVYKHTTEPSFIWDRTNTCAAECAWKRGYICHRRHSFLRIYLWWSLCTLYIYTRMPDGFTVGDSGLCCCVPCLSNGVISLHLLKVGVS